MSERLLLSWPEAQMAANVGVQRRLRALANGRQLRWGPDGDNWTTHIEAAAAELAIAKFLDRYWADSSAPDYAGDVGREQVRHTMRDNGCLILHPGDLDAARFWLVTGQIPEFVLVGFAHGEELKRTRFWRDQGVKHPAFFVPQEQLHSPQEFRP